MRPSKEKIMFERDPETQARFTAAEAAEYILELLNLRAEHFSSAGESFLFDLEGGDTMAVFYQPDPGQEPEVRVGALATF